MKLVTGATGIVGSHLVLELLKGNEDVRILHRPESKLDVLFDLLSFHGIEKRPALFQGDLLDAVSLDEAMQGCNAVYHSAALVSFNDRDHEKLIRVNTKGTQVIVNLCLKHEIPLCYISSTAAIGDDFKDGFRSEESEWSTARGKAAYTLSKRYAELEVFRGTEEGLETVVVNPGIIIGPGNWGQSSTSIFLNGIKGMRFYPEGSNGFVDARDVAEFSVKMMESPSAYAGQHLLIGENLSFKHIFDLLAKEAGVDGPRQGVSSGLIKVLIGLLRLAEMIGINRGNFSSNSLRSSITKNRFSNQKMRNLVLNFAQSSER